MRYEPGYSGVVVVAGVAEKPKRDKLLIVFV